jgi:cell division protein FtsI (penicillin-binding protein 3)
MNINFSNIKRITFLSSFLVCLFGILFYRFFHIQVVEHQKWTKISQRQYEKVEKLPFERGVFYSNTELKSNQHSKIPFVVDVICYHLYVDPKSIPETIKPLLCASLCKLLHLNNEQHVLEEFYKDSHSRRIKAFVELNEKHDVELFFSHFSKKYKLAKNALYFVQDRKRKYPFGHLLGQVLHTVRDEKDPMTKQWFPTGGLEYAFDKILQGSIGSQKHLVTPRRKLQYAQNVQRAKDGAKVFLTIDHHIQAICEKALEEGVIKSQAKGGWVIVIDPNNGHLLALAQYPFFDPNHYATYFNDPEKEEYTRFRGILDLYEPGSIMKGVICAMALMANEELKSTNRPPLFDPDSKMPTSNPIFPGRKKPLKDVRLHYFMNMDMAIQKSSNIYVARLAEKMIAVFGNEWFRDHLMLFGFGKKTNIELPSEQAGVVPMPGKLHPNGTLEWSRPTPYSIAMGHNFLATSLQVAVAYCVFANGGYLVEPTLIKRIERQGRALYTHTSKRKRIMSEEVVKRVVESMKYTTKRGGSSHLADVYGYSECGKSGSSEKIINGQYSKDRHISSFVGFSPTTNARVCIIISIDEPKKMFIPGLGKNHHGGICAAPIFHTITNGIFEYLGVEEDDPYGYPSNDVRFDFEKADHIKKTKELRELYEQWNTRR